jgi:hypothetical protein
MSLHLEFLYSAIDCENACSSILQLDLYSNYQPLIVGAVLYSDSCITPVVDGYYNLASSPYPNPSDLGCYTVSGGEGVITSYAPCGVTPTPTPTPTPTVTQTYTPTPTTTQTPTQTNTPTPSTTPPPNSVEWFGDPYVGYGGDPSGGNTQLNGTVEIIGDPVTFRAYVYIPFVAGGGSASTNIWVGTSTPATNRYVEIVSPPNDGNAYSTSFTLPAGTYDWQVNFGWFGDAGSGGEGGIDWVQ